MFGLSILLRAIAILLLTSADIRAGGEALAATELSIMSFNTWGAGSNEGLPIDSTVAAIRAANPDLVGLQEIRPESARCTAQECPPMAGSLAPRIAAALGYELIEQPADNEAVWANAILSRHPIIDLTPSGLGARIDVHGRPFVLFNIHATDYPYQPYQLLGIPYGNAPFLDSSDAAVSAARAARSGALRMLLADLEATGAADAWAVTGDFNEPSHRDWTAAAVAAGLHPMVVGWPMTLALEAAGFTDAFRAVYPDEVARPGFTWSPGIGEPPVNDHRDRIDYVFVKGVGLRVLSASVVGEPGSWSDLPVDPWPSDHRAVLARIRF